MRSILTRLPVVALSLAATGLLAGCIVAPPRHARYYARVEPVRVVHTQVWVPGYWAPHRVWISGRWR